MPTNQKDISEKTLMACNDVFADVINFAYFKGRKIVKELDLADAPVFSQYKADGGLHEQERDVAKLWKNGNIKIALYGLENQTQVDKDMPLRIMGYDGAYYRQQLLGKDTKERYPIITLVLYFGKERWNGPKTLKGCLKIPKGLEEYVSDYKINILEVAFLTKEEVKMFKSDFQIIADYFVQSRTNPDYKPSRKTIRHVDEMLKAMSILTGDPRFVDVLNNVQGKEKVKNMCVALDNAINKGIAIGEKRGEKRGRAEGRAAGFIDGARNLMARLKISAAEAVDYLAVPAALRPAVLAAL